MTFLYVGKDGEKMKDDDISRRAIFHDLLVMNNGSVVPDFDIDGFWNKIDVPTIKNIIRTIPAADVQEVKHGQWLQVSDDDQYEGSYICSECNTEEVFFDESSFFNYCPHCGTKMDGGKNNDR